MRTQIPESILEPFEPHGMPFLFRRDDSEVIRMLRRWVSAFNRGAQNHERPMVIDDICYYLGKSVRDAGASNVVVTLEREGSQRDSGLHACDLYVQYSIYGTPYCVFYFVFSKKGFV